MPIDRNGEWVTWEPEEQDNPYCVVCESEHLKELPHDDGLGYVDVEITCKSCGERTWVSDTWDTYYNGKYINNE